MNCPTCFGVGEVLVDKDLSPVSRWHNAVIPCPECGGCGIVHCCDGYCTQLGDDEKT